LVVILARKAMSVAAPFDMPPSRALSHPFK
jgi:hypothetical protein